MEEDEHTDRKMQIAMLCQRLQKIKRDINDDDTDNINKIISSNSPESCLNYLTNLEKKGDPEVDHVILHKLMDCYTQVFSNMPLGKYCQNQSYARMLVRFAELKALQDVSEAQDNFNVAISHCQDFAFVHIAHAQFELSQGNLKKSMWILQRAFEQDAKPKELLQAAVQNLKSGRGQLLYQENKENFAMSTIGNRKERVGSDLFKDTMKSDEHGESPLGNTSTGADQKNCSVEDQIPFWRSSAQRKKLSGFLPGRVPMVALSILEDDADGIVPGNKSEMLHATGSLSRQTSASRVNTVISFSQSRTNSCDGDLILKPPLVSPGALMEDVSPVDSTTTLLHRRAKKEPMQFEDTTESIARVIDSNSPELCWTYLTSLEKSGDPHCNSALLARLLGCYTKVFDKLPLSKHSKNESYARLLVRFAELKGIEDPDDAQDNFLIARSNSRAFAFVHVAHAQFELSQGNIRKSTSILQKALGLKAKPIEMLEMAMKNLKAGKKQLISTEDKENIAAEPLAPSLFASQRDESDRKEGNPLPPPSIQASQKPLGTEPLSEWRVPARINKYVSPEERKCPPESMPTPRLLDSLPTPFAQIPSRLNPPISCQTPNYKDLPPNSFVTPVMKQRPAVVPPTVKSTRQSQNPVPLLQTPQNQGTNVQQSSQGPVLSNESITIKGQQFFILKMIGRGGSSKVYQVLDQKKQLYAIKYVNLEEADAQTVEGYKNEIEHLNHLQQYSDQIIKLYDYEITNSYIYMLMECGSLDLNTWLRKRKTVDPLERKFYWRNMLEAVQTIHKHGIVHSDLKPANFVIVNASLKLIDFGIANHIQPDMTSIMKDSTVGTLNYMPPEAIRDTSSKPGKQGTSKISPKGDVWSLGCILYCMTYGKTPFQSITNQFTKSHAIIDPSHNIEFPDIAEKNLLDVLKKCLVRNPKERISIAELLEHPYLQIHPQQAAEPEKSAGDDLKRILNELAALQSPNSIARAASNLAKMCNSGKKLDVAECVKSSSQPSWKI